MATGYMFGAKTYNNPAFKALMNKNYESVAAMRASIARLKDAGLDTTTMTWGQYQPILSPPGTWPGNTASKWQKSLQDARDGLATRPYAQCLSQDEPTVFPGDLRTLVDLAVRKCFNSEPPIPMIIDVMEQRSDAPDANQHNVSLVWEYGPSGSPPILLRFTMFCPFGSL